MALPFFNSLRHIYPDSIIIAICKSHVAAIFENHPSVNGIIEFEKKDLSGIRSTTNSGTSLKSIDLDEFYLLSDSYRAAYLAFKSKSPVRIGYSGQGRNRLLSKVFFRKKNKKNHRSKQYIDLLNDKKLFKKQYPNPGIILSKSEIKWARKELTSLDMLDSIAVFPFSIAKSRKIPQEKIISFLNKTDKSVLIFGSLSDSFEANRLIKILKNDKIKSLAGNYSLRESIALISNCKAAIASDSGLGHISSNLDIPTVSLFGAGDPELTRPLGGKTFVISKDVYCSPCLKNECHNKREYLLCLKEIESDSIWEAISNF